MRCAQNAVSRPYERTASNDGGGGAEAPGALRGWSTAAALVLLL